MNSAPRARTEGRDPGRAEGGEGAGHRGSKLEEATRGRRLRLGGRLCLVRLRNTPASRASKQPWHRISAICPFTPDWPNASKAPADMRHASHTPFTRVVAASPAESRFLVVRTRR